MELPEIADWFTVFSLPLGLIGLVTTIVYAQRAVSSADAAREAAQRAEQLAKERQRREKVFEVCPRVSELAGEAKQHFHEQANYQDCLTSIGELSPLVAEVLPLLATFGAKGADFAEAVEDLRGFEQTLGAALVAGSKSVKKDLRVNGQRILARVRDLSAELRIVATHAGTEQKE